MEFLITDPTTGKKYKVRGESPEGAVAALKKMLGMSGETKPQEDVVATTKDGGRIVRGSDGNLSFTSPGYSTSDPEQVKRIMEGATPAETSMRSIDEATIAQAPAVARVAKTLQGVPFVGQYTDEAAGLIGGEDATQGIRALNNAMDRQNPVGAAALQLVGGVAGSIPMALAAGPALIARAPAALGSRVLAGMGVGAAAGGTEGAVSGYGRGEGDNRGMTAVEDGIKGAVFGGALGAAAPVISDVVKAGFMRLKGRDVATIAGALNISEDAARVVKSAVENDDFAAAQAALKAAGPDAMLADAGPGAARMLDTATKASGQAARVATDAIEPRLRTVYKKLASTLDNVLGPVRGIREAAKSIAARTADDRGEAYLRAYSAPIDYGTGGKGERILAVLNRVPARILQAATAKANEMMQMTGKQHRQWAISIADDGSVRINGEMPSVMQLDYLKRALDAVAQESTDNFGRPTDGGALKNLSGELRRALGDAVPLYDRALKLGADKIAEDNALRLGQGLLTGNVNREQVAEFLASQPSKPALEAARAGLRSYIDETMARVTRTLSDPNVDARETMKIVKDLSSRDNREKVEAILGKARASALFRTLDEATSALELRTAISRNSDTFARGAMDRTVRDIVEAGPVAYLKQGKPGEAARRLTQILTGATKAAEQEQMQRIYADIARALTSIRGPQAEQALETVNKAIQGQPISEQQAALIAQALSGGVALGGYQLGTRYLPTQSGAR